MTLNEVIELIQEWIVTNGNEEITADVLRPILEAMVNQPNDLIGDLDNLTTTDKDNLVEAINEVRSLAITNAGLVIHSGSGTPIETPPVSVGVGDFYAQVIFPSTSVVSFWQYNGSVWVEQRPQRTRTILHFVSLVGVTVTGKSQVQWMAEAINLNISNGAVYECEPGDIIDFYVNLLEDPNNDTPLLKRVFTRLITGETSVTSVDENDLMPDGSEDVPIDSELIIELGDIGTDNVWDAFNTDVNQPFEMDNEMFVSAIQNGDNKLWQWIGGTGIFGSTETLAVEADFLDLTEQPPITTYQLFRKYDDIAAMLADQATQIAQQGILVLDATDDPNITFPSGLDAELKYAYYQKIGGSTTGTISDYRLISAPYGNHTDSKPLVTPDTATEITLYPFGNFCNSYAANLETTEFTFLLTDESNPAGESATVLIKTDSGASDFPTLANAEYVEGTPFEADAYFDLYAWHNGATVAYTFLSRTAPVIIENIDVDNQGHYSLLIGQAQFNPSMYGRNNYSAWSIMKNKENDYAQVMYLYNHLTKQYSTTDWGSTPNPGQYHSNATTLILNDGKILTASEIDHNDEIVFKRSLNPYDISTYETLASITGSQPAYPNLSLIGDRIYCFMRGFSNVNIISWSDDFGATFTTPISISQLTNSDDWAYPRMCFSETKLRMFVNRRDQPSVDYSAVYYYESIDGINWNNVNGTYSKNISVDGFITDIEMDANYKLGDLGFIISSLELSENEILLHTDEKIIRINEGVLTEIDLVSDTHYSFSGAKSSILQKNGFTYLICKANRISDDVRNLVMLKTSNYFQDFQLIVLSESPDVNNPISAFNFNETQRTPIVARHAGVFGSGTLQDPDNSYSTIDLIIANWLN